MMPKDSEIPKPPQGRGGIALPGLTGDAAKKNPPVLTRKSSSEKLTGRTSLDEHIDAAAASASQARQASDQSDHAAEKSLRHMLADYDIKSAKPIQITFRNKPMTIQPESARALKALLEQYDKTVSQYNRMITLPEMQQDQLPFTLALDFAKGFSQLIVLLSQNAQMNIAQSPVHQRIIEDFKKFNASMKQHLLQIKQIREHPPQPSFEAVVRDTLTGLQHHFNNIKSSVFPDTAETPQVVARLKHDVETLTTTNTNEVVSNLLNSKFLRTDHVKEYDHIKSVIEKVYQEHRKQLPTITPLEEKRTMRYK